jgi:HPt (histidine-containing phosphotransfer) domain-containing protein
MAASDNPRPVELAEALDRLWKRFQPQMRERLAVIQSAALSLGCGRLDLGEREQARSAAHKLAGVLGTFNLSRGTEVARELELVFCSSGHLDPESTAHLAALASELESIIDSRK